MLRLSIPVNVNINSGNSTTVFTFNQNRCSSWAGICSLTGMHKSLFDQMQMQEVQLLEFEECLVLLFDREITERENHKLQALLRKAKLHQQGAI